MQPMAQTAKEALGSMGADNPIAVLSDQPQLLYAYFKQLFAQVTNPPLDAIREQLVTSAITNIGPERDLFQETENHCRMLKLERPLLTNDELERVRNINVDGMKTITLSMLYKAADGGGGLKAAMDELCAKASAAAEDGYAFIILSDRGATAELAPIPALLATSGVHHHLIRNGQRTGCDLVIESGEPREVHHFCLLFGYGAAAINPYLAFETLHDMIHQGMLTDVDQRVVPVSAIRFDICKGTGLLANERLAPATRQVYRTARRAFHE